MKTIMKMGRLFRPAALAASCLLSAAVLMGCGGGEPSATEASDGISVAELPAVGGCETVRATPGQRFSVVPIRGVDDLYVVRSGNLALCIDSHQGVDAVINPAGEGGYAASNPMPGDPGKTIASSNPMPGDPGKAASNPMPGVDPGSITTAQRR